MCFCFITYGFAKFDYKNVLKEGICLAVLMVYVFLEIVVLKIDHDPFYFMPNNEVMKILGIEYSLFLPLFLVFIVIYFSSYYAIPSLKNRKLNKK